MKSKKLILPYLLWIFAFTVIPLVLVISNACRDENGAFTLEFLKNALNYKQEFFYSLWVAFISTAICLVLAYPLSYFMARSSKRAQRTYSMLIMVPMWMNFLLRVRAWVLLLQNKGPIDSFLNMIGIDIPLMYNSGAVILGMVYEFLPFMILPLYTVMGKIDKSLIEAAQDLGCSKFNVIRKVVFPLSVPGIISGITMVFVPSISTFYISQKLGSGSFDLIGDTIERQFQNVSTYNIGAAISLVMMILILISVAIMNKFSDDGGEIIV